MRLDKHRHSNDNGTARSTQLLEESWSQKGLACQCAAFQISMISDFRGLRRPCSMQSLPLDGVGDGVHRLVLPHHPLVQRLGQVQQLLPLRRQQLGHLHTCTEIRF